MYANAQGIIGLPVIGTIGAPDTTQRMPLGTIVDVVDPFWGGGEAIYIQHPLSTAVKVGALYALGIASAYLASLVANTALLQAPVAVNMNAIASSATAQFGWALLSGNAPVWSSASVAANTALGVVAAGQAGAIAAGKAINGMRSVLPATTTVIKANTKTVNGSTVIQVANTDGWFVGLTLTGTGIAATTLITAISNDGHSVTMSNAATADGSVSVTGTYTSVADFWNVCVFQRPSMQGPIT